MTHEHFCIWLAGYLDGNADMDLDLKDLLREKLATVGMPAAKVQPRNDVPRTPADDAFRSPGITGGLGLGLPRGGVIAGGLVDPVYTLTNSKVEPSMLMNAINLAASSAADAMSSSTMAISSATDAIASPSLAISNTYKPIK